MPITGYITVTFNATYLGDYRICWRDDYVSSYTCFLANCSDLGTCTVYINPITFNTNTCDQITYNGYVQAACEDPNTTDGAVFWTVVYTPVTDCVPWELTCLGVTTVGGFNINITGSGNLSYIPTNPITRECTCDLSPKFNAVGSLSTPAGGSCPTYNTNLIISPWGNTELDIQAYDALTQIAGNYHWTPGTVFCGTWQGGNNLAATISDISCDACGDRDNVVASGPAVYGDYCIYKPIVQISPPPPGGTQATAEAIMGFGGLLNSTPITTLNQGSGGTDGTYYAWNKSGLAFAFQPGAIAKPRGRNYFRVIVTGGKVTSITPCDRFECQPNGTQFGYRGYYWHPSLAEDFEFNPSDIGNVIGAQFRKPGGQYTNLGYVLGIRITNPGSGYISTPTVSFSTNNCSNVLGVTNATLSISSTPGGIGPCPPFVPGDGCGTYPGNVYPTIPALPAGSTFTLCYPNNVTNPPWTITDAYEVNSNPGGCCYDCVSLLVEPSLTNPNPTITFTNCNTSNVTVTTINSNQIFSCVVNNSWVSTSADTTFTVLGPCTS